MCSVRPIAAALVRNGHVHVPSLDWTGGVARINVHPKEEGKGKGSEAKYDPTGTSAY